MTPSDSPRSIRFGTFEVDLVAGELRKSGVKLKLTGQPFQIPAILLARPGEVVTRDELQKRMEGRSISFPTTAASSTFGRSVSIPPKEDRLGSRSP